jgi:DNA uptake protein ComE-like DNA-binding protein
VSEPRLRGAVAALGLALGLLAVRPGALPAQDKAAAATAAAPLDLNAASEAELVALKHVGKKKAKQIIKGRPWARKDDLVQKGILTPGEYAAIKDLIVARQR